MVGVVENLVPVIFGQPDRELVWIEGRPRDHGENLAGVGVHRHDSADLAVEGLFCRHLNVEVNGELQILAGNSEFLAEVAKLLAVAVDDDVAAAVFAAEQRIVGLLDAGATYDVARRVKGVAGIVEHLLGDLTHVADKVGREAVAGVEPTLFVQGLQLGQLVPMGRNKRLLVGGDVLLERDGLIFGRYLIAAQRRLNLVDGDVQPL